MVRSSSRSNLSLGVFQASVVETSLKSEETFRDTAEVS